MSLRFSSRTGALEYAVRYTDGRSMDHHFYTLSNARGAIVQGYSEDSRVPQTLGTIPAGSYTLSVSPVGRQEAKADFEIRQRQTTKVEIVVEKEKPRGDLAAPDGS